MEEVRVTARIPKRLRDWLKESGKKNNRSMNGELINVLEEAKAKEKA